MPTINPTCHTILLQRCGHDSLIALATCVDGIPSVRTVDTFYHNGSFYVLTHAKSNKMIEIEQNPLCAICGEWFTAHVKGFNMGAFKDEKNAEIASVMREMFAEWIDNGHSNLTDEQTIILRLDPVAGVVTADGTRYQLLA